MTVQNEFVTLVTGGAGYIGTNVVATLASRGKKVVVIDNFSNSKKVHINKLKSVYGKNIVVYNADLLDPDAVENIFSRHNISEVIHLAGKKYVHESFKIPEIYEANNIVATQILLDTMTKHNVHKIIFSSSITVYGVPNISPVSEECELAPLSPYAQNKADGEAIICSWANEKNNSCVILRLSNPIGANEKLGLGNDPVSDHKELLPYLIDSAENGKPVVFNGNDHNTKDGTTVRDYISVVDVAKAFSDCATKNFDNNIEVLNIGTGGKGFSVLDMLKAVENATGQSLNYSFGKMREGDVSVLITDNTKARTCLSFRPNLNLTEIVQSQVNTTKIKLNDRS